MGEPTIFSDADALQLAFPGGVCVSLTPNATADAPLRAVPSGDSMENAHCGSLSRSNLALPFQQCGFALGAGEKDFICPSVAHGDKTITVAVELWSGHRGHMAVSDQLSVAELKHAFCAEHGIDMEQRVLLLFQNSALADDGSLGLQGVGNGSTLQMVPDLPGGIRDLCTAIDGVVNVDAVGAAYLEAQARRMANRHKSARLIAAHRQCKVRSRKCTRAW